MNDKEQAQALMLLRRFWQLSKVMAGQAPGQGNNPVAVVREWRALLAETTAFMDLPSMTGTGDEL